MSDYDEDITREYELDALNSKNTRKVMEWATLKVAKAMDDGYEIEEVRLFPGDKDTNSRLVIKAYKKSEAKDG